MVKRKAYKDAVKKLEKKMKILHEQMEELMKTGEDACQSGEQDASESEIVSEDERLEQEEERSDHVTSLEIPEDNRISENDETHQDKEKEHADVDKVTQNSEPKTMVADESPLDEEIEEALGENPLASNALQTKLHSSVKGRWKYWYDHGLQKEERDHLVEKYPSPDGLSVPKLNPEITLKLAKHAKARDFYMARRQQAVSSTMASIGWALTTLIEEKESVDKKFLIERLNDAGKLLADIMHSQTKSRVAFIVAGMDRDMKSILDDTQPGEFLFGKNLTEKVKEAQVMEKVAASIKKPAVVNKNQPIAQRQNLNSQSLQGKKPFPSQAGSSSNYQGQRLVFRNKPKNQPFNQRAQYQGQSRQFNQNRFR